MAKKDKSDRLQLKKAFMIMEGSARIGGFGVFMNELMKDMRQEIRLAGATGRLDWEWGGGDGFAVPVILTVYEV